MPIWSSLASCERGEMCSINGPQIYSVGGLVKRLAQPLSLLSGEFAPRGALGSCRECCGSSRRGRAGAGAQKRPKDRKHFPAEWSGVLLRRGDLGHAHFQFCAGLSCAVMNSGLL